MANNAGQVSITLQANAGEFRNVLQDAIRLIRQLRVEAAQLNSTLSRRITVPINTGILQNIRQSFAGLSESANQFGVSGERAARRTSRSINDANKSVTLLIAKFALLVFAAQTVVNIIDSTFGAALRNIDEFEQGVVSTAAAITNIADLKGGQTFGQAFAQNIDFVRSAFQQLEIIAGRFFSSATDLQLAYNTLAARGVVLRQEEFNTLGLITDQIKLQTKGQVSSIQIAQELRNLFTGQVRAADQLAQLIKAQGGNVKKISDEIRKTGSLKPLEPFVAGLKEAQGLIQGLLTPAIEGLTANLRRIGRFAFADIFIGVVDTIRSIDNGLTNSVGVLAAIGNLLVNRISRAFLTIGSIVSIIGRILLDIGTNHLAVVVAGANLILRRFSLIPRILGLLTIGVIDAKGGTDALAESSKIALNILRLGLSVVLAILNTVAEVLQSLPKYTAIFATDLEIRAQTIFREIAKLGSRIPGIVGDKFQQIVNNTTARLEQLGKERVELKVELAKDGEGNTLLDNLKNINASIEKSTEFVQGLGKEADKATTPFENIADAVGATQEEIGRAIIAQAKAENSLQGSPFSTKPLTPEDTTAFATLRRIFNAERELREAEAKRNLQIDLNAIRTRRDAIEVDLANRKISFVQAFNERQQLLRRETRLQLDSIQTRIEAEKDAVRSQRLELQNQIINADTAKERQKAENDLRLLNIQSATKLANLDKERLETEQSLADELARQNAQLINTQRQIKQLIAQRQRDLDLSFVQTITDRLKNLTKQQDQEISRLQQEGATPGQIRSLQNTQNQARLLESIRTPLNAALSAIDTAFNSIVDGIIQGSLNFKNIAQSIGSTLIQGGLQDLLSSLKKSLIDGLTQLFKELGNVAAQQAASALAVGVGLLFAVISRSGNNGSFTPGTTGAAGSIVESTQAVRGIIGGDTQIAIAEINSGLQEALVPTNNILSTIERNTRAFAELNLNIDSDQLAQSIQDKIGDILNTALLQVGT